MVNRRGTPPAQAGRGRSARVGLDVGAAQNGSARSGAAVLLPGVRPGGQARRAASNGDGARAASAVGYLRRSTDRQEQSIPDQQRAVERYCAERGLTLLRCYTDDAISGTSAAGRRAFQQLMADAQGAACDFGVVVCYDVKRFGRLGNDEAGYYRHLLHTHGVEVHYAGENFTGDGTDDLLRPVKQWQARQESKDLSKVTIRGLLSKVEGGSWMGGVPPHGYDLRYENDRGEFLFVLRHMPDGSKRMLDERGKAVRTLARGESLAISKRDRARLVPGDLGRVATIRRIFGMYVDEGRGLKAIADALNKAGTPTPRGPGWSHIYAGQGGWRDSTVRAILVNPVYAGDMVWNRRTDARFHMIAGGRAVERNHPHGARLVPNDEADWITVPGTHEGLVTRKAFQKAKAVRLRRPACESQRGRPTRVVGGWNGARSRFVLSGLVRCSLCGGRYQGVTRQKGKPRVDGTKVRTYSYACGSYIAKGTSVCAYNPVSQETLESGVIEAVLGFYRRYDGAEGHELLVGSVKQALGFEAEDLAEARARLDAERRRVEGKIAAILDNLGPATRDLAEERLADLREERQRLDTRATELDRIAAEEAQVQETAREVARFVSDLPFTLRHGLPQERLSALRRCVESVVINKGAGMASIALRPLAAPSLDGLPAEEVVTNLRR